MAKDLFCLKTKHTAETSISKDKQTLAQLN